MSYAMLNKQYCVCIADGSVSLKEFEASAEGIIEQYVQCYGSYDAQLEAFWEQNRHFWEKK